MTAGYRQIWNFAVDESGATAIEYGLIAALVAVGMLIALTSLGGNVIALFESVSSRSAEQFDNIDEL
jgi:pilus assembly protein Flp/PilA